jgi:hypothetical protein
MSSFSEVFFLALIVVVLVFGIAILFHRKKRLSAGEMKKIQSLWKEIESMAGGHPEQAILKADKLLDFALGKAGYKGSLGEKLKKSEAIFSDINAIWSAHKLRNRIAHDVDIKINQQQTTQALKNFKKALSDLGIPL